MSEETREDSMVKDVHHLAMPSLDGSDLRTPEQQHLQETPRTTNAPTATNRVTPNWIAPSLRYPWRTESATYAARPAILRGSARTKTKEDDRQPNRLLWLNQEQQA